MAADPEPAFRRIGLVAKREDPAVPRTLAQVAAFLRGRGCELLADEATASQAPGLEAAPCPPGRLGCETDLVVVVGGDGTFLRAARTVAESGVPLLGINLGRLGFLVDVSPDEIAERLGEVLAGHYVEDRRALLHARVLRDGAVLHESDALNDVVVHKADVARMIEVETYIDGRFVCAQRADGLIVSTPTGSTAYALSGGGPILHPALDALVLVPICPHTLSNRPIVVSGGSRVEVVVGGWHHPDAAVTCDGQDLFHLQPGDRVEIRRREQPVRLLHPPGYDPYEILRRKLGWLA